MPRKPPKSSRTFADAMRESAGGSDEGLVWSGGILEKKPANWMDSLKGKLGRLGKKKDDDKPAGGPELTLYYVRKMRSENEGGGGCFGCATILLCLSALSALTYNWTEFSAASEALYFTTGEYYWRLLIVVGLPVFWLITLIIVTNLGSWYRERYKKRLETACEELDPLQVMTPDANLLAGIYYGPTSGLRYMLFGRIPKTKEEWTDFLGGNLDLYLESIDLYRLSLTGWLVRTPYFWYVVVFALSIYLPQLQTWGLNLAGLSPELIAEFDDDFQYSAIGYAFMLAYGFTDSLVNTRKFVFADYMYRHLTSDVHPEFLYEDEEE